MPRLRRKMKQRREDRTEAQRRYLLYGIGRSPFETEDEERAVYLAMRAELLADWQCHEPGTRPECWWRFDAPERRRCIGFRRRLIPQREVNGATPRESIFSIDYQDDAVHPFDDPARQAGLELYMGVPNACATETDASAVYESEAVYLNRLGLLTAQEREALAGRDLSEIGTE